MSENIIGSIDIQFEMERADLRFKLKQAIATLPERCREIFIEICVEGNSYADTAEKYNLSVNAIKAQISRAYKILREKLSHDEQLILLLWCMQQNSFRYNSGSER
nr:sigma factor-like helix-turn-helix DNA-binding protein [uncultured Sanguibacteroides sp.]